MIVESWGRNWRPIMWAAIATLLLLPLVAMQFTTEVDWTAFDFAAAATLLVGAGLCWEFATRFVRGRVGLAVVGAAIIAVLLVIWAEGAVGIF